MISAAERADGLPWVDLGVGRWSAERHSEYPTPYSQRRGPRRTKCRAECGETLPHPFTYFQKHQEPSRALKNRPEPSKASQIFPEPTKTIQSLPKKASRRLGGGAKPARAKHPKCSAHQNCNDFQSKAYAFNHVSSQSYRWTHAGPSGVENATPSLEMHPTPVPMIKNATPSLEMRPKMQPLRQNLTRSLPKMQPLRHKLHGRVLYQAYNKHSIRSKNATPCTRNAVGNATPSPEIAIGHIKHITSIHSC